MNPEQPRATLSFDTTPLFDAEAFANGVSVARVYTQAFQAVQAAMYPLCLLSSAAPPPGIGDHLSTSIKSVVQLTLHVLGATGCVFASASDDLSRVDVLIGAASEEGSDMGRLAAARAHSLALN